MLSGSHGRSFRICHEKLRAVPPRGEITVTSYDTTKTANIKMVVASLAHFH